MFLGLFPVLIFILMLDLFLLFVNNISNFATFDLKFCLPFLKLNKRPMIFLVTSSSVLFFFSVFSMILLIDSKIYKNYLCFVFLKNEHFSLKMILFILVMH